SFLGEGTDPDSDPVTLTWLMDGAPLATGPGPHDVAFPDAGVFTVTLGAADDVGLEDATPASLTVTVIPCLPPVEVTGLRVARAGGDVRVTWTDLADAPDEYVAFDSSRADRGFVEAGTSAGPGASGLDLTEPAPLVFLLIRARNLPDCLGP